MSYEPLTPSVADRIALITLNRETNDLGLLSAAENPTEGMRAFREKWDARFHGR
jgi:hypothetical protein